MRALLALTLLAPAVWAQDDVVFRTDVRLVRILATVQDANGAPIGGLNAEDFQIVDGDEQQQITVFERRTDRPLSVVLLVDASLSTAIELKFERASAKRFAANLLGEGAHPDDRLAVMKFSEGVELLADFSNQLRGLEKGIDRLKAESGTSLYDGVLLAAEELERREGRRVIVVISDGGDTTSFSSFRAALEQAHAADVVVYGLTVQPIKSDAGRNVGGENALRMFADQTGGISFVEYGEEALNRAFDEIVENLRTQYLLGYYPPEHADPKTRYRRIEVTVSRENAQVLARQGYYVPKERTVLPESSTTSEPVLRPPDERRWRTVEEKEAETNVKPRIPTAAKPQRP